MINENNRALIVQKFLQSPEVRENFDAFFNLTYYNTSAYLKKLKRLGFNLSSDKISNEKSFDDLVYDILGSFFRNNLNKPYYIIFDYFEKQNILSFNETDPSLLFSKLQVLLYGFIHQELTKIYKQVNPQVENLKRRFKEILKGKEFKEVDINNSYATYYISTEINSHIRENYPIVTFEELEQIAIEAYHISKNRVDWCLNIFKHLNERTEYSNCIKKSDLLGVVVKVNAQVLDVSNVTIHMISNPANTAFRDEVEKEKNNTISLVKAEDISKYVNKGRLDNKSSEAILIACYNYLDDFSVHTENDSLPSYLFDLMPDLTQKEYQKEYKNICDIVFRKAIDDFKVRLKNNSTIKSFRDYYI